MVNWRFWGWCAFWGFLIWWVAVNPHQAGQMVHGVGQFLGHAARSASTFVKAA
jgi:hypothetical protein